MSLIQRRSDKLTNTWNLWGIWRDMNAKSRGSSLPKHSGVLLQWIWIWNNRMYSWHWCHMEEGIPPDLVSRWTWQSPLGLVLSCTACLACNVNQGWRTTLLLLSSDDGYVFKNCPLFSANWNQACNSSAEKTQANGYLIELWLVCAYIVHMYMKDL